jgi:hypothetical protein
MMRNFSSHNNGIKQPNSVYGTRSCLKSRSPGQKYLALVKPEDELPLAQKGGFEIYPEQV